MYQSSQPGGGSTSNAKLSKKKIYLLSDKTLLIFIVIYPSVSRLIICGKYPERATFVFPLWVILRSVEQFFLVLFGDERRVNIVVCCL
jgi:hypothetical protein